MSNPNYAFSKCLLMMWQIKHALQVLLPARSSSEDKKKDII